MKLEYLNIIVGLVRSFLEARVRDEYKAAQD